MDTTIYPSYQYKFAGCTLEVNTYHNPYGLHAKNLFSMALRNNPKRKFLFVSKLLGKHIPVKPYQALALGKLLAVLYAQQIQKISLPPHVLPNLILAMYDSLEAHKAFEAIVDYQIPLAPPHLFLGFAETATALGHSVFDAFVGSHRFIHTTREPIAMLPPLLAFDEEHSHAVEHRIHPCSTALFEDGLPMVLVDDELTTGKSALNLIEALHQKYPRKAYTLLSILDWRGEADKALFEATERRLDIQIHVLSLLGGSMQFHFQTDAVSEHFINQHQSNHKNLQHLPVFVSRHYVQDLETLPETGNPPYLKATGRFGLGSSDRVKLKTQVQTLGEKLKKLRTAAQTLCLGTEEFMYLPMQLAANMGSGVYYQSTTRSPIFAHPKDPSYAIQSAYRFEKFNDKAIRNFIYNIPQTAYAEVFLFLERDIPSGEEAAIRSLFLNTSIQQVHLIIFSKEESCEPSRPIN